MREEWFVVDVLGRHRLYKTGTKKHIGETTFMGISPSIKIINGNISIHSHTKDRAFSYRDFQTNCMEAHCAEMRVISKHYRFTLRPPPWPPKELLKNFKHQERYGTPPTEECRYRWDVMRDLYEGRFKYFLREGLAKAKRKQLNKEIPEGEDAEWFYGSVYAWQEIANYYGATFTVEKIGPRYFRGAKKKEDLWKHQEKEDW
jgi:hypothetical protein